MSILTFHFSGLYVISVIPLGVQGWHLYWTKEAPSSTEKELLEQFSRPPPAAGHMKLGAVSFE